MAKGTEDALLRIKAKNLASKELREVSNELDKLSDAQQKNADAALLARRKLNNLRTEYENLRTIEKELARRQDFIKKLQADKAAIGATQKRVRELTAELNRLQTLKAGDTPVKGINAAIKKTETAIRAANTRLAEQSKRFDDAGKQAAKIGINAKRTGDAMVQVNEEVARTALLTQQAEGAMRGYSDAVRGAREALRQEEEAQRAITAEVERKADIERRASEAQIIRAREQLAAEERIAKKRADSIAAFSQRGATASVTPFSPGNDAGERQARSAQLAGAAAQREAQIRENLIRVLARQKDGGERLISNDGKLAAATRQVSAALEKQASDMDRTHRLGGLLSDTGRKSLSVYQRLRGQILATAAAYVGLYQAVNLVRSAVTAEQERRRIEIQLETANNGNLKATASDMIFLREQADKMGLVYEDVARNFANFKIAAAAVGASNATIRKSFVEATQVVTGLALSVDDAEGVFRAFVQILGKNRVQAEELRGQLGDRLPGAVATFAKSLVEAGKIKSFSDLDAYLKKGKANVQDFFKFLEDYAKKTQNAALQQSGTLFAQFNRLTNAYRDFLVTFSKGGVSKELLTIVDQLISKLKGSDGKKFAKDLSDAFVVVGKVLLFVIDNFDTLVTLLKYYLSLQAAKAILNVGIEFAIAGNKIFQAAKFVKGFATAALEARTAGVALTIAQRGMLALMGPLGIAIAATSGLIFAMGINSRKTEAELNRLLDKMKEIRTLKGQEGVAAIRDLASEIRTLGVEEKALLQKRADLQKQLSTPTQVGGGDFLGKIADAAFETTNSLEGVNARLQQVQSQIKALAGTAVAQGKRLTKEALAAKAAAEAAAREQDHFEATGTGGDGPTDAEIEAAKKREEALAEKRRDIADRSARELLDIEKALGEARLEANITTQEQIDANLKESLANVSLEIEKKRNELEALKHDAERAGSPEGVASAAKAISMLPQLQAEQEAKLKTKAITDGIELAEQHINDIIAQRDAEIDLINTKVELGLMSEVEGRQEAIDKQLEYKDAIVSGVDALTARLEELKASDPDLAKILHVDELIAKLGVTKVKAGEVVTSVQLIAKNLGGQLATGITSFFSTFIKGAAGAIDGVKGIGGAFQNALNGFKEFLANFLVGIGEAILQAILLQAILNALGFGGGKTFTQAAVGALTGHTGGVVGSDGIGHGNPVRQVSAAMFLGAQRYHEGGLPGLKAGEVPAILKKREEVLTADDPRNVLNGGMSGGAGSTPVNLSIVNGIDSGSVVEAGLNTSRGKQTIFNIIRADRQQFRQLLR